MLEECVFCNIANGKVKSEKVYDDDNFIGILDNNPRVEGHTLIIPKKHFRNLLDLPTSMGNELLEAIKKVSLKLIEDGKGDGVNVLSNNEEVAGQLVMHTHIHIIPRKNNDNFKELI
jgi:histidine triad (HIT) family protein